MIQSMGLHRAGHNLVTEQQQILYETIMVGICHTLVKTQRLYNTQVDPNVSSGVKVIMMCQYRLTNCNK